MGALITTDLRAAGSGPDTIEARVHEATLACISRFGLTKTTLDDIARESGVSRATVYRAFPGGRDTLLQGVLVAEIDRFFDALRRTLDPLDDLEDLLVAGLGTSMRFLWTHEALRTIVSVEPGVLLPRFAFHRLDVVLDRAGAVAAPYLRRHVATDREAATGAEHLVRILLSYTMHPDRRVDPFDDASIRRLVRHFILPGLVPGRPSRPIQKEALTS